MIREGHSGGQGGGEERVGIEEVRSGVLCARVVVIIATVLIIVLVVVLQFLIVVVVII